VLIFCTACAIVLFLCGLMKAMSGYGPGTGLACIAVSALWILYLHFGVDLFTPLADAALS